MHCSDEELLAHFDGELSVFADHRVQRHLKSCWRCRTRLAALEEEIRRLLVETDEWHFPPPEWNRGAMRRLTSRLQEYESTLVGPRKSVLGRLPIWIATAAILVAGVTGAHLYTRTTPNRPQPSEVIAHAARTESSRYAQPVHQTFSLRIAEIRPSVKSVDTQLQVWTDGEGGRFAYRLSGAGGVLKHALWRPSANHEFVYHPGESRPVVQHQHHHMETVSLAALADDGLDPAQIEAAFMHWMESRPWTPIAFSADLSLWAAADGSVAQAKKIQISNGASAIRLTVRRRMRKVVALLSAELDSNNFLPRLQTIRFEAPERAVEFRLEATGIQTMQRSEIVPAVFSPDPGLDPGPIAGSAAMLRLPTDSGTPTHESEDLLPAWDIDEIRARYALHQAGACLGESVRISEEATGVSVLRRGGEGSYPSQAPLAIVLSALNELRDASPPHEGDMALRHAWALRHLVGDLRSRKLTGLTVDSLDMIQTMMRDHVAGVREGLAGLGATRSRNPERALVAPDWRKAASALLDVLNQLSNESSRDASAKATRALASIALDRLETFSRAFSEEMDLKRSVGTEAR